MRILVTVFFVLASLTCTKKAEEKISGQGKSPLFEYKGKIYTRDDLPEEMRVSVHEAEQRYIRDLEGVIEGFLVKEHVKEVAEKEKKAPEEVKKSLFEVKELTDSELKEFYEKKKDKIPYPFETVKAEIKKIMQQDRAYLARQKVVDEIKASTKFESLLKLSEEPKLIIATEGFPSKGTVSSKVEVVEFADFMCPHCYEAFVRLKTIWPDLESKVDFKFMFYPLNEDTNSINYLLAKGGLCAHQQNKFWEYHDSVFANKGVNTSDTPKQVATSLGIDVKGFETCLSDVETLKKIQASRREGDRTGVKATPIFFVNGKKVYSDLNLSDLTKAIEAAAK